jgi:RNA polymerase sigma factor (sigma-70 family)
MNDLDLLRQYKQQGSEEAFATLVDRHLKLVYATALRHVRSPQLAEEAAQSAFLSLARNAGSLAPNTILTAWLYRVTRHAAIDLMRGETRRHSREQTALELADMKSDSVEWEHIEPLLDEALEALEERDRTAVLLRYFENKSLREVGDTLGTSEDAARKRVSRAVEQLRSVFSKRGVAVGAASLVVLLSAHAAPATPAGLSATITAAVALTSGAVQHATTLGATKTIAMTLFQKTLITAAIAAAMGAGIYEEHRASRLGEQANALRQEQDSLAGQNKRLQQERDDAVSRLDQIQQEANRPRADAAELLKLRGEVARLRGDSRELAQLKASPGGSQKDPTAAEMKSWMDRAKKLKERLAQMPEEKIPEFQLLTDQDWLDAVRKLKQLETDADFRSAIGSLKAAAKSELAASLQDGLAKYADANNGQLPADFSQLKHYLAGTVDDSMLQGYEFTQPGTVSEKANFQVDQDGNYSSSRIQVSPSSISSSTTSEDSLKQAIRAFATANGGQNPTDPVQLLPYVQTPDEKAALQKLMQFIAGK